MSTPESPQPIEQARSAIWIASYPKSGNTWVQNVVRAAGRELGFPATDLDVYKMMREGRKPTVVSGVQTHLQAKHPTVLKTHARYHYGRIHSQLGLETAGFVYVIRNPLDLLLSYINFSRIQYANRRQDSDFQHDLFVEMLGMSEPAPYEQWRKTTLDDIPRRNLDHALKRYTDNATTIPTLKVAGGSWFEHARSWVGASTSIPSVVLRYEDLIRDNGNFQRLRELFEFEEQDVNRAVLAVHERSLESKSDEGTRIFLNKMTSYYYPDYFSEALIRDFLERYADDLNLLGYGDLPVGGDAERHPRSE